MLVYGLSGSSDQVKLALQVDAIQLLERERERHWCGIEECRKLKDEIGENKGGHGQFYMINKERGDVLFPQQTRSHRPYLLHEGLITFRLSMVTDQ